MTRADIIQRLANEFDTIHLKSHIEQMRLYVEMMKYDEINEYAIPELNKLKTQFIANHDYEALDILKSLLYYINIDFTYSLPERTFYAKHHNVHDIARDTEKAAIAIIKAYPAKYYRPNDLSCCEHLFDMIENCSPFNSFHPKHLFASIYKCINQNTELMNRLKEEMYEAKGLCLTGYVTRLVNVLRGYDLDPDFDANLDEYEYERCKTFHLLTRTLLDSDDMCSSDNIAKLVNTGVVAIHKEYGNRILEAFTGNKWILNSKSEYVPDYGLNIEK